MEMFSEESAVAPRSLEELVEEFGGPTRVARLAEVDKVNFWRVRKGKVVPQKPKATRIAAVFGLKPEEVAWPRGFTEDAPHVPPRRGTPRVDLSELYEDEGLRAEISALVERQQRLSQEQQEIAAKLATFGDKVAAQTQVAEGK
ncbi:MAG: hypothetical protein M3Q49_06305 [Actinomycetota bacterium]|nr:hypothetical protein [Actinomycetota bacterium]PLS84380.1 MAG: hypothetical protein CYG60_18275 [Actinomycetota bacterium]